MVITGSSAILVPMGNATAIRGTVSVPAGSDDKLTGTPPGQVKRWGFVGPEAGAFQRDALSAPAFTDSHAVLVEG